MESITVYLNVYRQVPGERGAAVIGFWTEAEAKSIRNGLREMVAQAVPVTIEFEAPPELAAPLVDEKLNELVKEFLDKYVAMAGIEFVMSQDPENLAVSMYDQIGTIRSHIQDTYAADVPINYMIHQVNLWRSSKQS